MHITIDATCRSAQFQKSGMGTQAQRSLKY